MDNRPDKKKPIFDIYAFADYSGASKEAQQRKAIAWCVYDQVMDAQRGIGAQEKWRDADVQCASERVQQSQLQSAEAQALTVEASMHEHVRTGLTRRTLLEEAIKLLKDATAEGKRVILGFDHNYSFPIGLYEAIHLQNSPSWRELLAWIHGSLSDHRNENLDIMPRQWAAEVNQRIAMQWSLPVGPFWGPHFIPLKRTFPYEFKIQEPSIPFTLHEHRLVERQAIGMKTFYQIGGAGSVGLQSLHGMFHLHELLESCRREGVPLHAWPFDGWSVPDEGHLLVEVYPTLYLKGSKAKRSDAGDAAACAAWISEQDRHGELGTLLSCPPIEEEYLQRALLEGWIVGL
jgi:hypothetical protein